MFHHTITWRGPSSPRMVLRQTRTILLSSTIMHNVMTFKQYPIEKCYAAYLVCDYIFSCFSSTLGSLQYPLPISPTCPLSKSTSCAKSGGLVLKAKPWVAALAPRISTGQAKAGIFGPSRNITSVSSITSTGSSCYHRHSPKHLPGLSTSVHADVLDW
jgi:hypothetical protein